MWNSFQSDTITIQENYAELQKKVHSLCNLGNQQVGYLLVSWTRESSL